MISPQKISFGFYKVQKAAWLFTVERLSYIVPSSGTMLSAAPLRKVHT